MRIQYADPDPGGKIVREKQKKYKEIGSNSIFTFKHKGNLDQLHGDLSFLSFHGSFSTPKTFPKVICLIKI